MTSRHGEGIRDGAGLGLYISAFASVFVIPIGIALRSWEVPALAYLAIMAVCAAGGWMRAYGPATAALAWAVAWCAGAALAVALIAFGIHAIVAFEPHCQTTDVYVCFDTVGEQRGANNRAALLPIIGGAVLLTVLLVVGARAAVNAHRDRFF
ncbi:hypothetical protein [Spirillospora sp. NPDC029432]|uniref:hypothetical protein n=1 Tax=Spirillospora sp. NPDC029432 TaxID=3154599 RepID=UPI003456854C